MKLLAFFLSAMAAFPAVDGIVINRTAGKPQAGTTVVLVKIGQQGMQPSGSVKTDAEGRFHFDADIEGPALLQVTYQGVTYNHQLQPGAPAGEFSIYEASKQPGAAKVATHTLILEPGADQLSVTETFFFRNDGTTTFHDPDAGTLRFVLPKTAQPPTVMVTGPQGMPLQREPKTHESGVYSVDFPVRPGETRFDVRYAVPFKTPGVFAGKSLYGDTPLRIAVPNGVTVAGDGVKQIGTEPTMQAAIYEVAGATYRLSIEGAGALQRAAASSDDEEDAGPRIQEILPRVYDRAPWVIAATLVALACGFVILYRKGSGAKA